MKERKNRAVWNESAQRWRIDVQSNGQRRSFYSSKPGTRGQLEAEKKADQWLEDGQLNPSRKFSDLYQLYLDGLQARQKRTGHGSAQYRKMESLGRIWVIPIIGTKKIDRISNADYQKVIDAAFDAGRSRKTLLHISSLFSGVYKTARKNRIKIERPELLEIYEEAPSYPRDAMPTSSINILFQTDQIQERGKTVRCYHIHAFRIMTLLGLRRGEVAGLKWSDLNGHVLHVQRSINYLGEITDGKTKAANRKIYVYPIALDEFRKQRTAQKKAGIVSPWIFSSPYTGLPDYNGLRRQWYLFCRSNGIENVTLHELRHTTITSAMGRINIDLLKPVIGHTKSMDTFGVYGHETEENLKIVGDAMQEIFREILNQ